MEEPDILIVGAGSAGLTLALLLATAPHSQQLQIMVVDHAPAPAADNFGYKRVSALNLASMRLLEQLAVWQHIAAKPAYQHMQVFEADSFARIEFDAKQSALPELGFIVDNDELRLALYQRALDFPQITFKLGHGINKLDATARHNLVTLSNDERILARLVVGADGANSKVRQLLKMPMMFWDYDHHALVAVVKTSEPHGETARQVFLPTGPLALLPLADPHLCSIVWSTSPAQATELVACEPETFNQRLTAAGQSVLGLCEVQSSREVYPLKMRYVSQWVQHKVVLVADAAHTIHPLAGQGMNLGLMDVAALAELIDEKMSAQQDWLSDAMLRRYERWRKAQAQQMIATMEAFKRGFMAQHPALKLVRAVGMKLTDRLPMLKQKILASALGNQGDLPVRAREKPSL